MSSTPVSGNRLMSSGSGFSPEHAAEYDGSRQPLYLTCMKNSTTSVALRTAIVIADDDIEGTTIDERDRNGDSGARHQRQEDQIAADHDVVDCTTMKYVSVT
jgi:hypothetical protein